MHRTLKFCNKKVVFAPVQYIIMLLHAHSFEKQMKTDLKCFSYITTISPIKSQLFDHTVNQKKL
jgi:hypothetical protein